MIKLLLTLIMMFALGTSTVNAEEEATDIKDRISELAETKSASQSIINAEVDKLSEDELKTVIANVNDLTEPTEDDLAIEEAAISKLDEMNNVKELSPLAVGICTGVVLMFYSWFRGLTGHSDKIMKATLVLGVLLIVVMVLLLTIL